MPVRSCPQTSSAHTSGGLLTAALSGRLARRDRPAYTLRVDPRDRDVARILLSLGLLPPPSLRPALVVLGGLPGSGKSAVAHELQRRVPVALLQSDRLRKLLAPDPAYTPEENARLFGAIHVALERLLAAGIPTVLDATTLSQREREPLAQIAARTRARLILVWVEAPEPEVRRRLAARAAGVRGAYDESDAGEDVYQQMRARVEPIRGRHFRINTGRDYAPALDALTRLMSS